MTAPLTVFAPDPVGTDTTGETYRVSNGDFLRAVFGEAMAGALTEGRPVLVSFDGNPANKPARVWFGKPWAGDADLSTALPASANNYFSLAWQHCK
jgi:hypothetical protein